MSERCFSAMNNYVPFLKLKVNEVAALSVLENDVKSVITPFFDLPKKDAMTPLSFKDLVKKAAASIEKNLKGINVFFLDNFDIDDRLLVDGSNNYEFVIKTFSNMVFIPVIGLDRSAHRNNLVFESKKRGLIKSDVAAVRLSVEDFESFELVRDDIADFLMQGHKLFSKWALILDNRFCFYVDIKRRAEVISNFLNDAQGLFDPDLVVVTGSSVPSSIRDVVAVESEATHSRVELSIYREVAKRVDGHNLCLGDYTIVSPLYSDLDIPPEAMQNVIAAKIIYSYNDVHYVARGGALKTHPRGRLQYNDIAMRIVSKPFYRGASYSFGDNFLNEKANGLGSGITPSSILKPTINTHISWMVKDFVV